MSQKREKEEAALPPPIPFSVPPSHPSGSSIAHASNPSRSPEMTSATDEQRSRLISDISVIRADLSCLGEKKVESLNRNMKRQREENRCAGDGCRRKLGLMGFRCRCGDLFCSKHRYSDRHGCSYDYKAAGREAIARENPVVKAAKILKV